MKILAVSDFHGSISSAERISGKTRMIGAEILIICGDITHFGNLFDAEKMLESIINQGVVTIFIPGNCDPRELTEKSVVAGAQSIHGRIVTFGSIDFVGVGGNLREPEIEKLLEATLRGLKKERKIVFVSHTPPVNTKLDQLNSGHHVGSQVIRGFIEETRPLLAVCGHIHESRGIDKLKGVPIINPGPAKWGLCATIDVKDNVEGKLDSF